MNMDKLNSWLTLSANIGVLIGIIFLSTEIQQSNRIGTNAAETTISERVMDVNRAQLEYPEVTANLRTENPIFTPVEDEQARGFVLLLANSWGAAESAFRNGLIDESAYSIYVRDVSVAMNSYPGTVPIFHQLSMDYNWAASEGEIFRTIVNELSRRGY